MTSRVPRIGWYVHHHGAGHVTRMLAVRPHVAAGVVVCSSLPEPGALPPSTTWITLPRDDADEGAGDPGAHDPTVGGQLHWAPLGHRGHARRLAAIAQLAPTLDAMVVDVSVEVIALARLLGLPVVAMTQPGDRSDAPHALGRRLSTAIVAPWPALGGVEAAKAGGAGPAPGTDPAIEAVGGISRFDGRARTGPREPGTALALGGGSDPAWRRRIAAAEAATPGWRWRILDATTWVDDPWRLLTAAEVVVTAAGQNAIADAAAADARLVVLPSDRPFDEQHATADRLGALGLAIVPGDDLAAEDWPGVLDAARGLAPDWSRWQVAGAAQRAAAVIDRVAGMLAARSGRTADAAAPDAAEPTA